MVSSKQVYELKYSYICSKLEIQPRHLVESNIPVPVTNPVQAK